MFWLVLSRKFKVHAVLLLPIFLVLSLVVIGSNLNPWFIADLLIIFTNINILLLLLIYLFILLILRIYYLIINLLIIYFPIILFFIHYLILLFKNGLIIFLFIIEPELNNHPILQMYVLKYHNCSNIKTHKCFDTKVKPDQPNHSTLPSSHQSLPKLF